MAEVSSTTSSSASGATGGAPAPLVVVVDANEASRAALVRALADAGNRTLLAASIEVAYAIVTARSSEVDLVVIADDAHAPADASTALALARRLKRASATAHVPVLLVLDRPVQDVDLVRAADHGVGDVLQRPVADAVLMAKVRAAADQVQIVRKLRSELRFAEMHATVDPLTGLSNRRSLQTRLLEESAYAKRHKEPFAVAVLDLDHFKAVNDTHGHDEGDRVLRFFAAAVRDVLRAEDVAFRYGGEEFVLLLRACDTRRAAEVTERLRDALAHRPFAFADGTRRPITFSAGVAAALASEGFAGEDLVGRADQALYAAKRAGRDRTFEAAASGAATGPTTPGSAVADDCADPDENGAYLLRALRQARALIAEPERFISRGYAQDREGRWRPVGSEDAVRFSVLGAVVRVGGGARDLLSCARAAFQEHASELFARTFAGNQGEVTHDDALALLDATIAALAHAPASRSAPTPPARTRSGSRRTTSTTSTANTASVASATKTTLTTNVANPRANANRDTNANADADGDAHRALATPRTTTTKLA